MSPIVNLHVHHDRRGRLRHALRSTAAHDALVRGAEDLFVRHHLGILTRGQKAATARWIRSKQGRDGSWDEPYHTGTGLPGDFYLNYHLYRQPFPVMALGRLLAGADG